MWILVVLVSLLLSSFAHTVGLYSHTVQEVLEDGAFCKLEDGTVWEVFERGISFLWCLFPDDADKLKHWLQGDEIVLIAKKMDHVYYPFLYNRRTQDSVRMVLSNQDKALSCYEIQEVDSDGYYITLSDDSSWEIGWWDSFSTWHWKKGERILVYQNEGIHPSYSLINLDHSFYYRGFVKFATLKN